MNRTSLLCSLLVLFGIATIASAQRPGGPGGGGAAGMLMMEAVQKELNITDEQKGKLREAFMGQRANFQNCKI